MTKRLTIFISVGEEWINNQFASWMKDNLIYVEMFCISRRTTRNYFWNPFLHALYIANVIINGVWYYFQCKFSCSYFKIHSSKPRLTDTSLHGHLFFITDGFHDPRDTKVHSVFTLQWCPFSWHKALSLWCPEKVVLLYLLPHWSC